MVNLRSANGSAMWKNGWNREVVWCPGNVSGIRMGNEIKKRSISDPPPEWCPYEAEHVVSQDVE